MYITYDFSFKKDAFIKTKLEKSHGRQYIGE